MSEELSGAALREKLGRPIIDGDGHAVEYRPALDSYCRREGLLGLAAFNSLASPQERHRRHAAYMSPLTLPAENTLDLATATFPKLLYRRLPELGIDFAIVFPTLGQSISVAANDDVRRAGCRAENAYMMDMFGEFSDRLCPVAVIPMGTPQEAIEGLDHAVVLGFKAVMIAGNMQRPSPGVPDELLRETGWLDTFGIDSEYDYDPFWTRCVHHGVAPCSHTIGMGWGSRRSPSNYVYNQIGHFAATGEALAKSLFLGGVTRRFPTLNFAILEAGVGWATSLYADLVNRWEKRNRDVLPRYYKGNIDQNMFADLMRGFAPELLQHGEARLGSGGAETQWDGMEDDFVHCCISRAEEIRELFAERFWFGCEADDPATKLAFDRELNPFGAELRTIFSSDIGHWDVPDMRKVLAEAYELVERGWLDEDQFHDFTCRNVVRLHTDGNADFFEGTTVAENARQLVGATAGTEK
jgi:predicted TIM-barrel fold metal-dependent hydrolase